MTQSDTPQQTPGERTMIRLDKLTKRYPGQPGAAVEELTLDIPAGSIVVFVGPSGCGKTTTMKLINRLIEPTSGRIHLDGQDVTRIPVHQLRRRIGYAIQQGGLFPHRTVADNIATVPKMLGWDKARITARVDELLEMVGLDPQTYRGRRPGQLSGGQQQRVGVARALAGDPQVMLMDEPFGAIDPLNREALQNEFLRIQARLHKTIVFVTHDIDEAVKMGDRIALFGDGGRVLQYDTPERLLADPADRAVAEFIGAGAAVRRLSLARIGSLAVPEPPVVERAADAQARAAVLARAAESGDDYVLVVDEDRRPEAWLATAGARRPGDRGGEGPAAGEEVPLLTPMGPGHTLFDALDHMLSSNASAVAVVDGDGRYRGVLGMDAVRTLINSQALHTADGSKLQEV
ncbi:glycine betaine/carnitin ABC transporter ATP-binding protein [Streptomyces albus]|nr:glycine betaine/carnitin ABC transporter ATP-binding protein [Streptomyces albus]